MKEFCSKGGKARMVSMTPQERKAHATSAIQKRWADYRKNKNLPAALPKIEKEPTVPCTEQSMIAKIIIDPGQEIPAWKKLLPPA